MLHNNEVYYAVIIAWDELLCSIGNELTTLIYDDLLDEMGHEYFLYRNLTWDTTNENIISHNHYKDIISFYNTLDQEQFTQLVENIFAKHQAGNNQHNQGFDEGFFDLFYSSTVKKCPVCTHWEDVDDFSFDEELNLSFCNQNYACR
ncbi:hypothetical protein [Paenibacillus sp. CMAA1364]